MSQSFSCHCPERRKPIAERAWYVTQRYCNHSAFNGYHETYSDYSTVVCAACLTVGRTKAHYVGKLPLASWDQVMAANKKLSESKRQL